MATTYCGCCKQEVALDAEGIGLVCGETFCAECSPGAEEQYRVDNALVGMKDRMLSALLSGQLEEIASVVATLGYLVELWRLLGYAYKGRELAVIAANNCQEILDAAHHRANVEEIKLCQARAWRLADKYHQSQHEYMAR